MKICPIEEEFVNLYKEIGKNQGLDDLFLSIFSLTYISPDEIPLEELAKKTGYSLASISNKVKMLETIGMIRKVRKPGTKKVFVKAEKNMIKMFKELTLKKHKTGIEIIKKKVPGIIENFKNKKLDENQKKRLKILQDYNKQIILIGKLMENMLKGYDKALKEYEK